MADHPQHDPRDDQPSGHDHREQEHQIWVAQADEVARLRDEVRAAAEREAMEVVATARRKIRQVITDARRDLLILTAQLHATLGPPGSSAAGSSARALEQMERSGPEFGPLTLPGAADSTSPQDAQRHAAVQAALERAKAGIEALAQELEHVDVPAAAPPRPAPPRPAVTEEPSVRGVPWRPQAELTPGPRTAAAGRPRRGVGIGVALAAAILLTTGLVWLWPAGDSTSTADRGESDAFELPAPAENGAPDAGIGATTGAPPVPAAPARDPSELSLVLTVMERPAWIRTRVDGNETERTYDPGETLRIESRRQVELRVGDAGAVHVSVNGSAPEPFGRDRAAITRRFAPPEASAESTAGSLPSPNPTLPAPSEGAAMAGTARPESGPAAVTPPPARVAPLADGGPPRSGVTPPAAAPGAPAARRQDEALLPQPPAVTAAPPAAARSDAAPADSESTDVNVAIAGQQWLDAYHRQDARAMAALASESATITDERQPSERFPPGTTGIDRRFDGVTVEFAGDIAIYTARMTERRAEPEGPQEQVSRVAQIWTRREGQWQLTDVRIMSEARVGQLVR